MPSTGATGYDSATATLTSSVSGFSFAINVANLSASFKSALSLHGSANGIRVFDSFGSTEYARDTIDVDHSAGTGLIRFQITGSSGTSVSVRVYPDATGTYLDSDIYGADNAYDASTVASLPLSSDLNDRTSNSINGTGVGGISAGGGGTLGGIDTTDFDGTNDLVELPGTSLDFSSNCTVEVWVRMADVSLDYGRGLSHWGNSGGEQQFLLEVTSGSKAQFARRTSGNNYRIATGSTNLSDATWHHLAGRFNGSTTAVFLDGSSDGTASGTGSTSSTTGTVGIGAEGHDERIKHITGSLGLARFHNTDRPDAWIATEHDQIRDNATFWGTWTWTSTGGGSSIAPIAYHHRQLMRSA